MRVRLVKDLARHLRAGHPWVWRDALAPARAQTGATVEIVDRGGRFVARGLWDERSPIAVRVYTLDEREPLDDALVRRRLAEALAARNGTIDPQTTDSFRWCNGEGDFLPGIVVDLYATVAVVRVDGDAARALLPSVADAVETLGRPLGVTTVYERARGRGELLRGVAPLSTVEIREHGVRFAVDVIHGQKTGSFLDQRENRRALRPFADGVEVLNLFAYTGGFSVHAALAGARRVVSVDVAPAAIEAARENFVLNGLNPQKHAFDAEDAFAWLARAREKNQRYGLVIVDPPSFAPSEKARARAIAAYRDLHAAALAVVAPGGILAACSCSSHVTMDDFVGALRDGAVKADRALRLLELRGQPADHPTPPAFPEGRYLKMIIARSR